MARDFYINGPSMVKVKVGAHIPLSGSFIDGRFVELGLTTDSIQIAPVFRHRDVYADDFGPTTPAEVMSELAEVRIGMNLVHYDSEVLNVCVSESLGATMFSPGPVADYDFGALPPAGSLLGNYCQPLESGCRFVSLNIIPGDGSDALGWRFPTSYLHEQPWVLPVGVKASYAELSWRAVPYRVPALLNGSPNYSGEIVSSGATLWSHTLDED